MADVLVRDMTERDLARLGIAIDGEWIGRVGIRRGAIGGYGLACWEVGADTGYVSIRMLTSNGRGLGLGVEAIRLLRRLATETDLERVTAYPDLRVECSERWLRWLDFAPTGEVFPDTDIEVWVKELR